MDRWISAQLDAELDQREIRVIASAPGVEVVVSRPTLTGALLMVRVAQEDAFESVLMGLARLPGDGAMSGPGSPHEHDPLPQAFELSRRASLLSAAFVASGASKGDPNDSGHAETSAWVRVANAVNDAEQLATSATRAISQCYSGLLSRTFEMWSTAGLVRNVLTHHFGGLQGRGERPFSTDALCADLVTTWAFSVLGTGGAETDHPLSLGPRAIRAMQATVTRARIMLDRAEHG